VRADYKGYGFSCGRDDLAPRAETKGPLFKVEDVNYGVGSKDGRALTLVQRAYVLESGRVIMHGPSAELANNKQVQAAYLGI
jgi:branched-chain amino acid transport system ATP-binding protein